MSWILDEPWWISVVLIGALASIITWRSMKGVPNPRRIAMSIARIAGCVCLALALGGLVKIEESDRVTTVAIVDVSGSIQGFADFGRDLSGDPITLDHVLIGDTNPGWIIQSLDDANEEDRLAIIAMDSVSAISMSPRTTSTLNPQSANIVPSGFDGTDINAAIQRASSLIGADARGRIVLVSDGVSTSTPIDPFGFG